MADITQPTGQPTTQPTGQPTTQQQGATSDTFDYDKLAQIVKGKQSVVEDSVLKGYFKQQGLSKEEMEQAINTFKEAKAKQQPDVNAIKHQAEQAEQIVKQKTLENEALMTASEIGVDIKSIPYLLKLADLDTVIGADGNVNKESLKASLNKILEIIPQFKVQQVQQTGFTQIGANGKQEQTNQNDQLSAIFGNKK